ncbi:hypothetical protein MXB_4149, partial [Myxobolus squamalis]
MNNSIFWLNNSLNDLYPLSIFNNLNENLSINNIFIVEFKGENMIMSKSNEGLIKLKVIFQNDKNEDVDKILLEKSCNN